MIEWVNSSKSGLSAMKQGIVLLALAAVVNAKPAEPSGHGPSETAGHGTSE